MLRGVLGTASWRAQQMSPQFAADVSLLLIATAQHVLPDLLDANKLVRDMRRSAAQSLHFHSFNETPWHQLVFASWAGACDRPRPDGSRTDESLWLAGLLGQKCTVLRCDAGTWTKLSDRWVECSSQILEVSSMP